MRAAVLSSGSIYFRPDYAKPRCGADSLLVRVKAAAINPVDYKIGWHMKAKGPIVGRDFSGIIEEKGANVGDNFKVGDEVFGGTRDGTLAEFAVVKPSSVALKPKTASFVEAGGMYVTYMTTLQALRDYGKLCKDDRVLVIGASGGCGTAAIQLAKAMGAGEIVGVCSGKNEEFVKSLGATDVIDYTKQTIRDYCLDKAGNIVPALQFDVIYDAATNSGAGEDYRDISMELLKPATSDKKHGQYVAINGSQEMWRRLFTIGFEPNQHLMVMKENPDDLKHLAKLVDDGWMNSDGVKEFVKPVIAEELPLTADAVEKGFDLLKSRRTRGKIVFKMD
jgi:NADPH:quinone reductase-like Zn-dependent oxidoreductase